MSPRPSLFGPALCRPGCASYLTVRERGASGIAVVGLFGQGDRRHRHVVDEGHRSLDRVRGDLHGGGLEEGKVGWHGYVSTSLDIEIIVKAFPVGRAPVFQ